MSLKKNLKGRLSNMKIVILAAGKGSRLAGDLPKPLTPLANGLSILEFQLLNLSNYFSLNDVIVVVGYQKERILDALPDLLYVYSPHFARENTSKSLLRALYKIHEDVLWINGDVVFHPSVLQSIVTFDHTCMVVNQGSVGEEEVKYRIDSEGLIQCVSKHVPNAAGEALGINFFKGNSLDLLREELDRCQDNDYFEKGVEEAIQKGLKVWALPIESSLCTEVDFSQDLAHANKLISSWHL
jgi:L-glutamine-phosphate cytidylyltransferase